MFFLLLAEGGICQIPTPQPSNFQPVTMPGSQPLKPTAPPYSNQRQYPNTPTPQSIQQDQIRQQRERDELRRDIADLKRMSDQPKLNLSFPSHSGKPGVENYRRAYNELMQMLKTNNYDVKRAVFIVENAYLDNQLPYEQYRKRVENIGKFCIQKMKEDKRNLNSNEDKNEVLFHLLSDTLTITDPASGKKITHYPVRYDFDDPWGYNDWANMFVTKLMNTNYGQCHSMPLLYLMVAQEIGAKAYLATSPSHLYVKYKKGNQWVNVELTNGHLTSDSWVIASGYIKSEAVKSRMYLDTISLQQTIALCLEDLAKGYALKYNGYDNFALQCINSALQYYPNSWNAMAEKSDYYTVLFKYIVKQANDLGYTTPQQV